jgi:hypothetical protein
MSFQVVEARRPECAVVREPRVDLSKGLGSQCIQAPLAVGPHRHEPGLAQNLEVLGDSGLAERDSLYQLSGGSFPLAQQVEDLPAVWLG